MEVQRLAAFADGDRGGNPAGVVLCDALPSPERMQAVAAEVGYSETAFAEPAGAGFRVRYWAPAAEVPFCGHATVALGAALAMEGRTGPVRLELAAGTATVEGWAEDGGWAAALTSPPTASAAPDAALLARGLALFGLAPADLDPELPPTVAEAGARHLVLATRAGGPFGDMGYDLADGAALMRGHALTTVMLVRREGPGRFRARNAFAGGGVREDPATGAAAAALAGYLRALGAPDAGRVLVRQGDEIGIPCRITAVAPAAPGGAARVSGTVRRLDGRGQERGAR